MSSPPTTRRAVIKLLNKHGISAERYLDLGCGDGELTLQIAHLVKAKEVVGVDISEEALEKARDRSIKTYKIDLEKDPLPFMDNYFDLITAVEVLEYLRTVDNVLSESFRVLKPGGFLLVSVSNLGSWINRLLLLFGYQPMHTEPSMKYHVGLPIVGIRRKPNYAGHVNLMTFKALCSLLKAYNFVIIDVVGIHWHVRYRVLDVFDRIFSRIPSLAHGVAILAQKPKAV